MSRQSVDPLPEIHTPTMNSSSSDPSPETIIEQIKNKHKEIVDNTNEELKSINERIIKINNELQILVTKIKDTDSKITGNNVIIQNLESEKKVLDTKITDLTNEKASISSQLSELQRKNLVIETNNNKLEKEINAKKEDIKAAEFTINTQNAKNKSEIDHRLDIAHKQFKKAEEEKQIELDTANSSNSELIKKLKDDYESQIADIKQGAEKTAKETEDQHKGKYDSYEYQLQTLKDNFTQRNGQLELLQKQVNDLNKQKSENDAKILKLEKTNSEKNGEALNYKDLYKKVFNNETKLKNENEKLRKKSKDLNEKLLQALNHISNLRPDSTALSNSLTETEKLLGEKNTTNDDEIDMAHYDIKEAENNVGIKVDNNFIDNNSSELDNYHSPPINGQHGGKRKKSKGNTKKVKHNTTKNKHKRLNGNKKKQTQKRRSRKGKKVNRKK
jgi:intraflagellar transport protein 20